MKYHFTPIRLAFIKKSTNNKWWRGCEEKGVLLHCWGNVNCCSHYGKQSFPGGLAGKESACSMGDLGWEGPLRKEWLLTLVFCPGEFHGLYGPWGCKESDMPERLPFHYGK